MGVQIKMAGQVAAAAPLSCDRGQLRASKRQDQSWSEFDPPPQLFCYRCCCHLCCLCCCRCCCCRPCCSRSCCRPCCCYPCRCCCRPCCSHSCCCCCCPCCCRRPCRCCCCYPLPLLLLLPPLLPPPLLLLPLLPPLLLLLLQLSCCTPSPPAPACAAGGRCPCSFFSGTYYPSDRSHAPVPRNGCTTVRFKRLLNDAISRLVNAHGRCIMNFQKVKVQVMCSNHGGPNGQTPLSAARAVQPVVIGAGRGGKGGNQGKRGWEREGSMQMEWGGEGRGGK